MVSPAARSLSSINTEKRLLYLTTWGCWNKVEIRWKLISSSSVNVLWVSWSFFQWICLRLAYISIFLLHKLSKLITAI